MIRVYGQRFFFFFERRNLQFPNDLACRYMMWFDSKKREHSYETTGTNTTLINKLTHIIHITKWYIRRTNGVP